MKATDDLHRLLHSLTQNEKRYVKVFASKQSSGDNSNAMLLFDAILEQKEYDEQKLKDKLKGKSVAKHLSPEKSNLYRIIIKSMRMFHAEKSVGRELREMLIDIRFLIDKRLYDQGIKELLKAKKLATKYENFIVLIEILLLEREIVLEKQTTEVKKRIAEIHEELYNVLNTVQRLVKLTCLSDDLFTFFRSRNLLRNKEHFDSLEEISNRPEFNDLDDKLFYLQQRFHVAHVTFHSTQGNYLESFKHNKEVLKLWEKFPHFIEEDSQRYKKNLSNYLGNCLTTSKFEEFPAILDKIRAVPCRSDDEEAEEFQNVYFMELLYCMNMQDFEKAEAFLPEIEKGMKKYENKINKARELAFYHNIAIMFFIQHKYKEATTWVRKIIDNGKSDSRQDIQHFARVFNLVLSFESGKTLLFEHDHRSVQRYLKQNNTLFEYETALLHYLRKLCDADKHEAKELFRALRDKLDNIRNQPKQERTLGIEELILWSDSHIHHKPMLELLKGN